MTTPLIEAIARAITPEVLKTSEYYCDVPPEHVWSRPRYGHLKDHATFTAQAALTAIAEAGYICAPKEPTPAMISEAWKAISAEKRLLGIAKLGPGPAAREVYRAMISAAQGDGE